MTVTPDSSQLLSQIAPFNLLSPEQLDALQGQLQSFRIGQPLITPDGLPERVLLVVQGEARLRANTADRVAPISLGRLGPGSLLGWVSLLRGIPCEQVSAATDLMVLSLASAPLLDLVQAEPLLLADLLSLSDRSELYDLIARQPLALGLEPQQWQLLLEQAQSACQVLLLQPGTSGLTVPSDREWWVSGIHGSQPDGSLLSAEQVAQLTNRGRLPLRLVSIPAVMLAQLRGEAPIAGSGVVAPPAATPEINEPAIAASPEIPAALVESTTTMLDPELYGPQSRSDLPLRRGRGSQGSAQACLEMVARYHRVPAKSDKLARLLREIDQRQGQLTLPDLATVGEWLGLSSNQLQIPLAQISRAPLPALAQTPSGFVVISDCRGSKLRLADPARGYRNCSAEDLLDKQINGIRLVSFRRTDFSPEKKFGLSWFWPSLRQYRVRLLEVFIASCFVQLVTLANPLVIQQIIDKVIAQGSLSTLNSYAILLIVLGVFQALLTSLRTYLFVDTTNRIDLRLGSEIIDHLLRLPLRYFERRPVGELSSRLQELENIRSFLTDTALITVLDALFAVIYIGVMIVYSWQLTLVALLTVPLLGGLTWLGAPLIRQQLRHKAERNAETQSHLVEILSGIQTVKAQNIELKSRWTWQKLYSRYINSGFRNVITSTGLGSTSEFLNQLSSLLVLWLGVYLVIQGDLTLGGLIAFRIIAGYVTQPLMRLSQLWQRFQQTGLSLERLADIVDYPQESDSSDRGKIPMPSISGQVRYEDVSFRFGSQGAPQLLNVNLEIPAGSFIGIVGQSGSGKSTLMKLLPRLYPPMQGRVLIDGYDIDKVELYSLRRQIGIVPQDSLLFEGTIEENIALTNPNASSDEVIEAARLACAHDFIMGLPQGYNTRVGERGGSLSGGQRQRIAIARTILQNPRLLVLDEATSALDYDTERQVSLNLMEHFRGRTVFFITHRLSTVRHADRIIVMHQGKLDEQGSHDELMELQGRYYCLYRQQEAEA